MPSRPVRERKLIGWAGIIVGAVGVLYEAAGPDSGKWLMIFAVVFLLGWILHGEARCDEILAEDEARQREELGYCYWVDAGCAEWCKDGCQMKRAARARQQSEKGITR